MASIIEMENNRGKEEHDGVDGETNMDTTDNTTAIVDHTAGQTDDTTGAHSLTYLLTHSHHSLTYLLTHSLTYLLNHSLTNTLSLTH
jgi:hypothetical protein